MRKVTTYVPAAPRRETRNQQQQQQESLNHLKNGHTKQKATCKNKLKKGKKNHQANKQTNKTEPALQQRKTDKNQTEKRRERETQRKNGVQEGEERSSCESGDEKRRRRRQSGWPAAPRHPLVSRPAVAEKQKHQKTRARLVGTYEGPSHAHRTDRPTDRPLARDLPLPVGKNSKPIQRVIK